MDTIKKLKKNNSQSVKIEWLDSVNWLPGILLASISEKISLVWKFAEEPRIVGKWVQIE